jgi:predicted phage tail protein
LLKRRAIAIRPAGAGLARSYVSHYLPTKNAQMLVETSDNIQQNFYFQSFK